MEPRHSPDSGSARTAAFSTDWGLWGLLAVFATTATYFSIKVPAFETPDEFQHYAFVQHVVTWYDLPKSEANTPGLWRQQGVQAPLYYIAGALLTAWVDQSALQTTAHRVNRFARLGQADALDNRNYFLPHADDAWPWSNEFLALHILRFLSIGLGCLSLWAIFRFLQLFLDKNVGLLCTATCAFIPQFVFISSAASNDNLVIAAACLLIWQLAEMVRASQTASDLAVLNGAAWRIGLLLAVALLAKLSGLGLVGVAVLTSAWIAWRHHSGQMLWQLGWRMATPILLGSGWWFGRNFWLYGDPLAWNIWEANITLRSTDLSLGQLVAELPGLFQSFWGLFGWLTVPYPDYVYQGLAWLSAILSLAFGYWTVRAARALHGDTYLLENGKFMQGCLAFLWLGVLTVSWLRFMWIAPAAQGRYFFPALTAAGLALGLGITLLPPQGRKIAWVLPVSLAVLCLWTPTWILDVAYTPPPSSQYAELKLTPRRAEVGQDIDRPEFRLIGSSLPDEIAPGQSYPVYLRLEAVGVALQDYAIFIHLRDTEGNVLAQYDGLPGGGLWPTTQWPVGEIRTEHFTMTMPASLNAGARGQIVFGFYNPWTWMRPTWNTTGMADSGTFPNEIALGTFAVTAAPQPQAP